MRICVQKNATLPWEKARVIVSIMYFHSVSGFQILCNMTIAFVNNEGIVKINIVVVGPSMIGNLGAFGCCFYIIVFS